jgi:hypothetical protein
LFTVVFYEDNPLHLNKAFVLAASLIFASCAGNRATTGSSSDYVEIDNPAATMSPDAPAKIWVPRSYVESGVPRGGEILKKGTEKVIQSFGGSSKQTQAGVPEQQPVPLAAAQTMQIPASQQAAGTAASSPQAFAGRVSAAAEPASAVKNRIALLEIGQNNLVQPIYEHLRYTPVWNMLDQDQAAFITQYATLTNDKEKAAFATRLQQEYGVNVAIYISAPEGVVSGKPIYAEVYDAMAGGQLRRFDGIISPNASADQSDRSAAEAVLGKFMEKIRDLVTLLPWYGRIIDVEGNRAYLAAGKEAGLRIGQVLKIYQNGKFMKGLGFTPGEQVGTLSVQGFVGPNGSFGVIREGQGIKATDIVSVE